ncbi:MAG: NAD-dependent epimerase/dehydratase family protein [Candidatus Azobacteroides sp.]|nr:NAD-dependent epimerase/dehydratase family protein [Candidatus Azobacteroides sp.]
MNLLYTGATGFLGKNTFSFLKKDFNVSTLGLSGTDIVCDLRKKNDLPATSFDIVLHAAGKVHPTHKTRQERQDFFDVNLQGTKNLCAALEQSGLPKSLIFVSTVAVYGIEEGEEITEEHALNGKTPYALSKLLAEEFLIDWCRKNNVILSILRPALIAGFDPLGSLGSMVRGIKSGFYFNIAQGKARKSVVMAQDIVTLLPKLINKGGIYNLSDGYHPSFYELSQSIAKQLNKKTPISIPYSGAKSIALCGDLFGNYAPINFDKLSKIVNTLTFSNKKAVTELDWKPLDVLENFKI